MTTMKGMLAKLGFYINHEKSVFLPSKQLTFLGCILCAESMTVRPTQDKINKTLVRLSSLMWRKKVKIREVASTLGVLNDLCKAVDYGLNYVKWLEIDKIQALRTVGAIQFEGAMRISPRALQDIAWWITNLPLSRRQIRWQPPELTLITDASLLGWGAVFGEDSTGGRWSKIEALDHINILELRAVLLGLKCFLFPYTNTLVKVLSDNTTRNLVLV